MERRNLQRKTVSLEDDFFTLCPDAFFNILQYSRFKDIFQLSLTCKVFYEKIKLDFGWFVPSLARMCLKEKGHYKVYQFPRFSQLREFFLKCQFDNESFLKDKLEEDDDSRKRKIEIKTELKIIQSIINISSFLPKNIVFLDMNTTPKSEFVTKYYPENNSAIEQKDKIKVLNNILLNLLLNNSHIIMQYFSKDTFLSQPRCGVPLSLFTTIRKIFNKDSALMSLMNKIGSSFKLCNYFNLFGSIEMRGFIKLFQFTSYMTTNPSIFLSFFSNKKYLIQLAYLYYTCDKEMDQHLAFSVIKNKNVGKNEKTILLDYFDIILNKMTSYQYSFLFQKIKGDKTAVMMLANYFLNNLDRFYQYLDSFPDMQELLDIVYSLDDAYVRFSTLISVYFEIILFEEEEMINIYNSIERREKEYLEEKKKQIEFQMIHEKELIVHQDRYLSIEIELKEIRENLADTIKQLNRDEMLHILMKENPVDDFDSIFGEANKMNIQEKIRKLLEYPALNSKERDELESYQKRLENEEKEIIKKLNLADDWKHVENERIEKLYFESIRNTYFSNSISKKNSENHVLLSNCQQKNNLIPIAKIIQYVFQFSRNRENLLTYLLIEENEYLLYEYFRCAFFLSNENDLLFQDANLLLKQLSEFFYGDSEKLQKIEKFQEVRQKYILEKESNQTQT